MRRLSLRPHQRKRTPTGKASAVSQCSAHFSFEGLLGLKAARNPAGAGLSSVLLRRGWPKVPAIIHDMPAPRQTHYDVLGIPRTAKLTDVGRAYNRLKSDMQKEHAAPDPKRAALLKEAYEALSDLERREAYDKSLVATQRRKGTKGAAVWGVAIAAGTAAAGVAYVAPRPPPQKPPGARPPAGNPHAAPPPPARAQRPHNPGPPPPTR